MRDFNNAIVESLLAANNRLAALPDFANPDRCSERACHQDVCKEKSIVFVPGGLATVTLIPSPLGLR
jgi:hypothetical protein